MSFEIYRDGTFGGIRRTKAEPDGWDIYPTFTEARKALAVLFNSRAQEYKMAAKSARQLRITDVEEGEK